jgi:hypothetical protein
VTAIAPMLDQVAGAGHGRTVETTVDEADKKVKALDGFFLNADVDQQPRYRSFKEAYVHITGDKGLTGMLSEATNLKQFARVKEGLVTGSWDQILGDSIRRAMIADYRSPDRIYDQWRAIVSTISSPSDFRTMNRMRMGGFGDLATVAENGAYAELTHPADEQATYAVSKKGGLASITLEMIANDDVGAIRRIPQALSRAAKRGLYKGVFDLLLLNSNIYDSTALSVAGHNNYVTTALSHAAVAAARTAMAKQVAYGATDVLNLTPKTLVVPAALEETAWREVKLGVVPVSGQNATEGNYLRPLGLDTLVVCPYWDATDANNWWLVADPRDIDTIEVGFYQGREEPELFVADNPTVGSMFTADKLVYKIRFIWGVVVLDYRGFYGAIV